jgi:DNA-binding MarR family transcriptional regulator
MPDSRALKTACIYGKIRSEQPILEVMTTQKHLGHYFKVMDLRMEHSLNTQLQKLDLTSAQGHIIGYLTHAKEPPCARDLEKFFRLSHPTVSGLLSRMEAKGFIEIRPDPEDRRMKRIVLQEKGIACSRQIERCIRENNQRMIRGFSPEEEALFRSLLKRAVDNMIDEAQSSEPNREE